MALGRYFAVSGNLGKKFHVQWKSMMDPLSKAFLTTLGKFAAEHIKNAMASCDGKA